MRNGHRAWKIGAVVTVYQLGDLRANYLFDGFSRDLPKGETIEQLLLDPASSRQGNFKSKDKKP